MKKLTEADMETINQIYDELETDPSKESLLDTVEIQDVNEADENGMTLLMEAARDEKLGCLIALLNAGADVNRRDFQGDTPLAYAIDNCSHQCVPFLVESGADVNRTPIGRHAPLWQETLSEDEDLLRVVLPHVRDINEQSFGGFTALISAAFSGYTKCVSLLLGQGADVNIKNAGGETALHVASENCTGKIATLLIRAGASVNAPSNDGSTPLIKAAEKGNIPCVKLLLKEGALVNKWKNDGYNALATHLIKCKPIKEEVTRLLHAAVEGNTQSPDAPTSDSPVEVQVEVPEELKPKMELKHMCREATRKHLINLNPHQNLFSRIPQLPLPPALVKYLLFGMDLELQEESDDESTDDD